MNVKKEVDYLVDTYGTADPVSLIKETGAYILDDVTLPKSTLGMTVSSYGQTTLLISPSLEYPKKDFVLAHELGHIILHSGESTTFFRRLESSTQVSKIEAEANEFALALLLKKVDVSPDFNALDFVRSYQLSDCMVNFIKP